MEISETGHWQGQSGLPSIVSGIWTTVCETGEASSTGGNTTFFYILREECSRWSSGPDGQICFTSCRWNHGHDGIVLPKCLQFVDLKTRPVCLSKLALALLAISTVSVIRATKPNTRFPFNFRVCASSVLASHISLSLLTTSGWKNVWACWASHHRKPRHRVSRVSMKNALIGRNLHWSLLWDNSLVEMIQRWFYRSVCIRSLICLIMFAILCAPAGMLGA